VNFNAINSSFRDVLVRNQDNTILGTVRVWPTTANALFGQVVFFWYFEANEYIELFAQANTGSVTATIAVFQAVAITPEAII